LRQLLIKCVLFCAVGLFPLVLNAQKVTKVSGTAVDAETREPLAFVNVFFKGTQIGASTDLDGNYVIETRFPTDSLEVSYLGYKTQTKAIFKEKKQEINFKLVSNSLTLNTITFKAQKAKYSKKNNPAIELIKKVLANRKENSLQGQDFYRYDKYEKIELDLNNITKKFRSRGIFDNYQFVFDYVDTSEVNGKPFLPIFLRETISKVHYKKDPKKEKEIKEAVKLTNFSSTIDDKTIDGILNLLYQDVDIYKDKILLLGNQFIGPISNRAIDFYRFYIQDTITVDDLSLIKLAFIPRNKLDIGFTGHLYISNDDKYFVKKADLGIINGINLNFVRDLKIIHEFEELDGQYVLSKDFILVDYALTQNGVGAYGTRINNYKNFDFTEPDDMSVFEGDENIDLDDTAFAQDNSYWDDNRFEPLSETESGVYEMLDTLNNNPSFKRLKYAGYVLMTGYVPYKGLEIGPVPTFLSFNPVEGTRMKFGMETNTDFSQKLKLAGYVAYGTKDETYKYSGSVLYSFGKEFRKAPFNHLLFEYNRDVTFPGVRLDFIKTDNILLSIRRGDADRMLLQETFKLQYLNEGSIYDFSIIAEKKEQIPIGSLNFPMDVNGEPGFLESINTFEVGFNARFAPNQTYVQGRTYRYPILNEHPILSLEYRAGIENTLGGEYNYHALDFGLSKKFYLGILGQTRFHMNAGKVWGEVPYLLYHIPRANQTFSYQRQSYNMMNFMEFVMDQYVSVKFQHFFLGAIFNEIPLLRKLKLREVVTGKFLYGSLSDKNNPNLNPGLVQFQNNADGEPLTYTMDGEPYFEGSFGISNIFKFLRVDFVKRFTHLDHPNTPNAFGVPGGGIRFRIKVEF